MKRLRGYPGGTPARPTPLRRRIPGALAMGLLTLFLTVTGSGMVLEGLSQMNAVRSLNLSGVERAGTVTRIDTTTVSRTIGETPRQQTISLPVVQFDHDGRRYAFTAQAVSGDRRFEVGEAVRVVFPEGAPESAVLDEFRNLAWALPLALGAMLLCGAMLFAWAAWQMCVRPN